MSEKAKLRREKAEDGEKNRRKADADGSISRSSSNVAPHFLPTFFVKSRSFLNAQREKQPTKMQKAAADVGGAPKICNFARE